MDKNYPVIIIGAGLAGLSAVYHLKRDYILLEREDRVGGLCRTNWINGFGFDLSIHILYSKDPYAADLIRNKLLKGNFTEQVRGSWIYTNGIYNMDDSILSEKLAAERL